MYLVKGTGRDDSLVARLRDRLPVRVDGVHVLLALEPRVLDGLVVRERGRGLFGKYAEMYGMPIPVARLPATLPFVALVLPRNAVEPRRRLPLALSLEPNLGYLNFASGIWRLEAEQSLKASS